jgi:hypothetical protein
MKRNLWLACAALLIWHAGGNLVAAVDQNPCDVPGNLTYNCNFDAFSDHTQTGAIKQIPDGWWFFVLMGDPEFRPSVDTYWGAPSQEIWSDGQPFTAGLYQQVTVVPGTFYHAGIGWAAPTKRDFERRLGLDPTGGSDPTASTVIWGPSSWEVAAWPDLGVGTWATGSTMTVFVWVHHPTSHGIDQVFLDAVGLAPDTTMPTPTPLPPSPTPTRISASPTPSPGLPTVNPLPPTASPTPVSPTPTPTALPATPTASPRSVPQVSSGQVSPELLSSRSSPTQIQPPAEPTPPDEELDRSGLTTPTSLVAAAASTPAAAMRPAESSPGLVVTEAPEAGDQSGAIFLLVALGTLGGAGFLGAGILWVAWRRR